MENWHVPGCAVAVVREKEVVLAEGFGVRSLEARQPVTLDTLFAIGSCTKAFTAATAGILVDEGNLAWDTPSGPQSQPQAYEFHGGPLPLRHLRNQKRHLELQLQSNLYHGRERRHLRPFRAH
ncbi:MAG: beta-lactamase family protein [Armatimonadetes bacterium]|nr:beta-lactamase family protein [Armatimonadota bacterium]